MRSRVLALATAAVLALVVPALARAGSVPAELLSKAHGNPHSQFDVDGWVGEAKLTGASWSSAFRASASWEPSSPSAPASWASSDGAPALVDNASLDARGDG